MKFIVCQLYSQKAVKSTHSGTSSHQGASPLPPTGIPVTLADQHSLSQMPRTSPTPFPLPLQTLFVLQRPEQVLPPAGNLSGPL